MYSSAPPAQNTDRNSHLRERSVSRAHSRANSTGVKEELLAFVDDAGSIKDLAPKKKLDEEERNRNLTIAFFAMVFVGLCNRVFNKLMTIPMHNYPNFLNILTTFVYLPVCFAYIIPMARNGSIPKEQLEMSKWPFFIMGGLDALSGIMSIFAVTYLTGSLIILLSQASIPISMVISKYLLKAEYNKFQYLGALIVAVGIAVVLGPSLSDGSADPVWAVVMILSTIPQTLSSVYKEMALGEQELDPIYLNGWIAVFQLMFSLILMVPASMASDPPVAIPDLPANIADGLKCYVGISSYTCADDTGDDCSSDNCNPQGPMFVNIYIFFNQLYNLLIILILKYGGANIFYMAMTLMVPLGNITFTLPFIPENQALAPTDIVGLVVILSGLCCYRFAKRFYDSYYGDKAIDNRGSLITVSNTKDGSLIEKLNPESSSP